jgi:hypothetical protein
MIGCTNCGTLSRKGSKYCSNCGQRLQDSPSIACPICSRLNVPESTFCKYCGASLASGKLGVAAAVAQEPVPEPEGAARLDASSQASSLHETELPDWLYPKAPQPAQRPSAAAQAQVTPGTESASWHMPSRYLKDIPGVLPPADAWLKSPQQVKEQPVQTIAQTEDPKPPQRRGCLPSSTVVLLGVLALIVGLFGNSILR